MSITNNVWIDESPLASVVTVTGSPYQGSVNPKPLVSGQAYDPTINGGSTYFPQSLTPVLSIPYVSSLDFGWILDFTIEFWLNVPSQSGNVAIMGAATAGANNWRVYMSNNAVKFGNGTIEMNMGTATADTWTHFAIGKSGTTIRTYRNGVVQATRSPQTSDTFNSQGGIRLGQFDIFSYLVGYIGPVRIVNGTNLYPGGTSFTPSYVMTAVTGAVLVLNHTNIGIFDSACKANIRLFGGYRNDTDFKYGNGSLQANALGSYGEVPALEGYMTNALGTGDFTMETWIKDPYTGLDNRPRGLIHIGGQFAANGLDWCIENSKLSLYWNTTKQLMSSTFTATGWVHFAMSRQGNVYRLFLNGILSGSATIAGVNITSKFFEIAGGGQYSGLGLPMDDFRIIRNVARYIDSFTPPTSGLPKS